MTVWVAAKVAIEGEGGWWRQVGFRTEWMGTREIRNLEERGGGEAEGGIRFFRHSLVSSQNRTVMWGERNFMQSSFYFLLRQCQVSAVTQCLIAKLLVELLVQKLSNCWFFNKIIGLRTLFPNYRSCLKKVITESAPEVTFKLVLDEFGNSGIVCFNSVLNWFTLLTGYVFVTVLAEAHGYRIYSCPACQKGPCIVISQKQS